jgi:formylglycine-generating enzyme required for sulfatase activity
MSTPNEQKGETRRNTQAIASLVLGVASVILALFNFAPGLSSTLGCVGAAAAVLAFIAGVQGVRAARELDGQGRKLAIAGIATGGLGLLVFIAVMGSTVLEGILDARDDLEAVPLSPPQASQSPGAICDGEGCNGDTWTRSTDGMVMVYVPAGEFEMGSDDEEVNYAVQLCKGFLNISCERGSFEFAEQPVHTVALDGFWIDQAEVTNERYRRCVEAGACDPPGESSSHTRDSYYGEDAYDNYPVIWVSWHQAADYCAWAGARLPTEAEWEYAARGPQGWVFPWGNEFDEKRLNYGYSVDTTPVGDYPSGASWCETLDMAGNVWEWVVDWQGSYPSERQVNPRGPSSGEYRVLRGGSWGYAPYDARCASRYWDFPYSQTFIAGFRCASDSQQR